MFKFKTIILSFVFALLLILDVWIVFNFNKLTIRQGIVDKTGNYVSRNEYLYIESTDLVNNYGYINVKRLDLFGNVKEDLYIDLEGTEHYCINYETDYGHDFDYVKKYNFRENRAVNVDEKTNKKGYIDFDGNLIIEHKYDYAWPFENGFAMVAMKENKKTLYGVIDMDGNEIIPCKYQRLSFVSETNAFSNGVIPYLSYDYSYIKDGRFTSDLFAVDDGTNKYILDKDGKTVAELFAAGIIKFTNLNDLSDLGELNIENVRFSKNFYIITNSNNLINLYKKDGTKATDTEYKSIMVRSYINSSEEYILVEDTNNSSYYIDKDLNTIVSINSFKDKGLNVRYINNGVARIKQNSLMGVSDYSGNILVKPEYNDILIEYSGGKIFPTRQDNKYGLVDITGKTVIEPTNKYKDFLYGNDEVFVATSVNNKLSIIWKLVFVLVIVIECIILRKLIKIK